MKKNVLIPLLTMILALGILGESWAETTCNWDGTKLTIDGNGEFSGCSDGSQKKATEVTIGTGVTSIGKYAFQSASSLKSITILEGVTRIGNSAFYNASSLESITIPNSVTSIGNDAFNGEISINIT